MHILSHIPHTCRLFILCRVAQNQDMECLSSVLPIITCQQLLPPLPSWMTALSFLSDVTYYPFQLHMNLSFSHHSSCKPLAHGHSLPLHLVLPTSWETSIAKWLTHLTPCPWLPNLITWDLLWVPSATHSISTALDCVTLWNYYLGHLAFRPQLLFLPT